MALIHAAKANMNFCKNLRVPSSRTTAASSRAWLIHDESYSRAPAQSSRRAGRYKSGTRPTGPIIGSIDKNRTVAGHSRSMRTRQA